MKAARGSWRGAATHLECTTSELRLSEDVALFFRQLELAHARSRLPGRFVPFLVGALFHSWREVLGDRDRWEAIHRRDRYECSCPVCERQDVTLHHLTYRSHGGGDEAANLVSLCSFCHLGGENTATVCAYAALRMTRPGRWAQAPRRCSSCKDASVGPDSDLRQLGLCD